MASRPTSRWLRVVIRFMIVVPIVFLLSGCYWASPEGVGLKNERLKPCPSKPNCVSSLEEGQQSIEPLTYQRSADRTRKRLVTVVKENYSADLKTLSDTYIHLTVTTTLGFVDDLQFLVRPEQKTIHIRSASRIGYSDLGANRDRIEVIRQRFNRSAPENS